MLGIFGKKSGGPMADLKSARELLEEVPKNDAVKALLEISSWVDSVRSDDSLRLDNRFAILSLLDETARAYELKVSREYFSTDTHPALHEKRLWKALYDYFTAIAEAYHGVLVGCRNGERGASSLKAQRPLLGARGINATAGRLKYAAVHYLPIEREIWEQLAEYYADAESQKCLDEEIELYPGADEHESVRHQLAGILLWWASGTGSLKPVQIHLAERLTTHLSRSLDMGSEPGDDSVYAFDLAQPGPPARYSGDTPAHPNLRFVGLGDARLQIEPLMEKLEKGVVPGDINLGGAYDAGRVGEIAKRLAAGWTAPPSRRNVRRNINVNLSMLRGFAGLIDQAAEGTGAGGAGGSMWVAEDISATGFRCSLDMTQGQGIKVGSLVGFRPENVRHWGAGIVRRLRRDDRNRLDVGVEILTNRVAVVKLSEDGSRASAGESYALWLGHAGAGENESRVLLRPGSFGDKQVLRMQMADRYYVLMPQGVTEKGDDYAVMRYRMVERQPSARA